jgi:coatomer subunit delta
VGIVVDEKLVVEMTRDGAVENMEIKGTLSLTINNPDAARCSIKLKRGDTSAFQFQNHPNINKPLFLSDALLQLKDTSREFPVGSAIGVLRWRSQTKDESRVPLTSALLVSAVSLCDFCLSACQCVPCSQLLAGRYWWW